VGECQPPDEPIAYIYVRSREGQSTPSGMRWPLGPSPR
jgi:hypothetical protein